MSTQTRSTKSTPTQASRRIPAAAPRPRTRARAGTRPSLELGVIGNGTCSALIDQRGSIVWSCVPAFDGDPVFCALLSPTHADAGWFDVELEGETRATQHYLGNSAVLVTTLTAKDGASIEITDFAPRCKQHGRTFHPMQLLRRVRPVAGSPRVRLRLRPLTGYGERKPESTFGSNHVRFLLDPLVLRVTTDAPLPMLRDGLPFLLDRDIHLVLGTDETLAESPGRYFHEICEATLDYWREWTRYLSIPAEWQAAVIRAAITLKLCQYEGTGAIVAAMTTSIPEAPDTPRTWDYRYCWLRDAALVVRALNRLGATRSMEEYTRYVFNLVVKDAELAPVYGIHFQRELPERTTESLAGYRGMGPVRIGNEAWKQQQNDVYGSVVLAATQLFFDARLLVPGDEVQFHRLERVGEAAFKRYAKPDAGLWELRGRQSIHTYSAVMCWSACHRLGKIAAQLGLRPRQRFWFARADQIKTAVLKQAVRGRPAHFVESFDGKELDASLLLLADLGFVDASDPRYVATVDAIGKHLMRGGVLLRYAQPDDFGAPSTSFTICNFWYVNALAAIGRRDEARALFERLLAQRNHLGLLSEDLDPQTGELWGNFPQTYSMVGLIHAAMNLSESWETLL